ncbi:hypothetical protein VTN77DRAFT_6124 [Rasamsonia byssochlamydoides]|uniref:uncharacterized protein n=1 Tax=Rasamsonia byssochlamydoides TaxID=89139 RepID=UPI003743948B
MDRAISCLSLSTFNASSELSFPSFLTPHGHACQSVCHPSLVMDPCYHDQGTAENVVDNEQHSNQPRSSMDENKHNLTSPRRVASLAAFDRDLDSSESIPSDHSSLYDAVRASFVLEDEDQTLGHGAKQDSEVRNERATNALSLNSPSLSSLHLRSNITPHALETITEQQSSSTLRRSRSASQVHESPAGSDSPSKERRRSSLAVPGRVRRRKVVSFDDSGSDFGASNWQQGIFSPVLPTQPAYPPPVRSPTPPGLPSFGSIEALTYSPRFTIESSPTSQAGQRQRSPGDGIFRRRSHGGALRRLFGAPSPSESPSGSPSRLPIHAIARADDGTAVRGRFPYRQSGHGVDLTRPLDRHPFHRRHLPVATPTHGDPLSRTDETRRSKSGGSHEGFGPPNVADNSQVQSVGSSPSHPTPPERLETTEPRTVTVTSGVSEQPLLSCQQVSEAPVPQEHLSMPTNNASRNVPADGLIPTLNPGALPAPSPGVATTDGASETTAVNHQTTTSFWIGIWKNITDAFCCVVEEEEDTTRALYPLESRGRNANHASVSSTGQTRPQSRTRGSEFSQAGRRYSGPWRPAYGFHPGETSTCSVV